MDDGRANFSRRSTQVRPTAREPIAIIGVSGRYPGGARDVQGLWANLIAGVDGVGEAKGDRWDLGYYNPDPDQPGRIYSRCAGFIDGVDLFDAEFFGLSPRETTFIDPQQRLMLELAWEALEDANLVPRQLAGSDTGVFVGIASHDYGDIQANLLKTQGSAYVNSGGALSIAANRISYIFDFHGPSLAVDTACSSALVAIHSACVSLWSGESSLALGAGVNLLLAPKPSIGFCKASMISRRGRCQSFDADGDGYVRSEGGGVVVLKRLADAERDGDPIRAVILGSGVNSDGRTHGLSMPNEFAQEALLRQIYGECGIAPEEVFYVEAHGTGTPVGDPIECNAIGRVLGVTRQDGTNCLVGSIKSNIGHLETASGVAGLTKVLLALEHRQIPGNLHFKTPNPKIPFADLKLEVVDRPIPLPDRDRPLIMGVSSYGFGGTNAHVVVQEYRKPARIAARPRKAEPERDHLLLLSARSADALTATAAAHAALLRETETDALGDLCASAALLRSQHPFRLAVSGRTPEELAARLDAFVAGEPVPRLATARVSVEHPKLAFVFSGNGPQWWGMGRELLAASPLFRLEIERIDAIFEPIAGWSLIAEMARPESDARMEKTEIAQPMLFALQLGLTALLRSNGIEPASVVGHSVGEVAAAYVSGALSLEQAVLVIYERSRAQGLTAGLGRMAAVGMGWEETAEALADFPGWIEISAENSARSVTVAGDLEALTAFERKVTEAGIFFRHLALDYAFHSRAMDAIEAPLLAALDGFAPGATRLPFVSTVEGGPIAGETLTADYWWRNIRHPVRFAGAINHLLGEDGANVFLEIGPHPVLRDYVQQCARDREAAASVVPTLRRPNATKAEPELDNFWNAVCACYANGVVDVGTVYERPATPAALPAYPWQKRSYWSGVNTLPDTPVYSRRDHPLLGYRAASAEPEWELTVDPTFLPFLSDHVVQGATVFPATGFLEMILAGATRALGAGSFDIEDFDIRKALVIPAGEMPIAQLALNEDDGTAKIRSRLNQETTTWTLHVVGKVGRAPTSAAAETLSIDALRGRMDRSVDQEAHYRAAAALGLSYGPTFRGIERVWVGRGEALGEIAVPETLAGQLGDYCLHPCLFDACLQTLLGLADESGAAARTAYLPVQIARLRYHAVDGVPAFCHVRILRMSARSLVADIRIADRDGRVLAEVDEFRFVGVDFMRSAGVPLYRYGWQLADDKLAAGRPAQLPRPTVLADRLAPVIAEFNERFDRVRFYNEVVPRFERLAAACAGRALDELGARQAPFTVASLMARAGVVEEHRQYLTRMIDIAEADGMIERTSEGWVMPADAEIPDLVTLWRELFYDEPAMIAELSLVARSGERGAAVMRGEVQALQLLFPDKGAGPTDHLYDTSPTLQIYNHIARAIVAEIVRARAAGRRLRILELGGGTGGLAASLLPILPPEQTDYLFTDVSPVFLARAEHRFSAYRFLRFGLMNIERDPLEQGQTAGSFDIIVAADVLHVASDLKQALGHIKTLLAPGGQLLVIEKHQEWLSDVIFGQLKGWWAFSDRDLRTDSALLSPGQWRSLLAANGFIEPTIFSDEAALPGDTDDGETQHSVVLAQAPGVASEAVPVAEVATGSRRWLLLVGDNDHERAFASATGEALRLAGHSIVEVAFGTAYGRPDANRFVIAPDSLDDYARLLSDLADAGTGVDEIVHLAGMAPVEERSGDALMALQDERCFSTILLVQALCQREGEALPRLTLATSMAVAPPSGVSPIDAGQAPVWGLGHVLMNEHADLRCRLVDVQFDLDDPAAAQSFAAELTREDDEADVLLSPGERYVARVWATSGAEQATLARHRAAARQPHGRDAEAPPFRLDFSAHGTPDNLYIAAVERRPPGPGEIEIRVRAAGLNFRDVMWVMGMLPEEALEHGFAGPTIGMECAGEIAAVGEGVTGFAVGDRVIGFAPDCFANYVTTPANAAAPMPESLSFEEAATVPAVFFTAYYALCHLAQLEPGERVLIHGAAGGVGLAAIQIAKRCGAEIFGTAGSPEKRDILRLLGVDHVLDSRSLDFADEIMTITGGKGVDVVLNSLAGEAITKNLRILKPFGRFLEIGKRDLYANSKIGLRPFRNNLSYFGIDADTLLIERPALGRRLLREVLALFDSGELHPLPFRSFPVSRANEAFRQMQQSRQVGKLVISMDTDEPGSLPIVNRSFPIRSDGTYLITGGLSGFGLATAQLLVERGARHLALVGRRGATTEEAQQGIAAIEAAGASVRVYPVDVSNAAAVDRMMADVRDTMPPLRGVIHAAMVIDDCILLNLDREKLHRVMAPKILGAWNLHRSTLDQPLDCFVLYSSGSTMLGNAAQANYVSANMYLEALAYYRRSQGLPALALGWGPLSEVGYVARNAAVSEFLRNRIGVESLTPRQGVREMERLLAAGATNVCVSQFDWQRVSQVAPASKAPRYSIVMEASGVGESASSGEDLKTRLAELTGPERKEFVVTRLKENIGRVVGTTAAQIDADRPLADMGLDSLMAVELGDAIEREMKISIPVMELVQAGSINGMADRILKQVGLSGEAAPGAAEPAERERVEA